MAARKLVVEILGDAKGLAGALDQAGGKLSSFGASVGKVALGAGAALAGVAAASVPLINAASDLAETQSKVGVIFGSASGEIDKFASAAAKNFGQSKQQAMDAAATFATFGKAAGLSGKDLATFSTDFAGLASDLASFNNTSPQEAIDAIGAALRGEAEPMRRFGVLLDDASMREEALRLGLIKTTKEALTPQQKVLAAQALIYKQTKDAQGDFARTSDGLANKQRILSAQFANVQAQIGQKLLPVALKLATFASERLIPALTRLGQRLEGPLTNAFNRVAAFMRDDFLPVAERVFAWLAENVPPVLERIGQFITEQVIPALAAFGGWVDEKVLPALAKLWASFEENILPALTKFANFVRDNVLPVVAAIGQFIVEKVLPVVGELVAFIVEKLLPAFFGVVNFISMKVIPVFADIVAAVSKFVAEVVALLAGWVVAVWQFGGEVVSFFRELPGKIGGFFAGLGETILAPFKWAFNEIAKLWNNTVGKLSFTVPSWVPGIGGKGWDVPDIPTFHTGGTFRAPTPGGVGLAWLRDGERVATPTGGTSQPIIVEIGGQPILNALVQLDRRNGSTPLRVRAV